MFSNITDLLDKSVDMAKLKDFLDCYSHPLYPEQLYVNPKIYKDANTTKQLLKSLCPQFINFMQKRASFALQVVQLHRYMYTRSKRC